MKIIILEPDLDQSIALAKYIKKALGEKAIIIGSRTNKKTNFFRHFQNYKWFDKYIVEPDLKKLINQYDIVIPAGGKSTQDYANTGKILKIGTVEFDFSNLIFSDKIKSLELVENLNVPIPKTYYNASGVKDFPVFFKEKNEISKYRDKPKGIIRNKKELDINSNDNFIYQEYIEGKETYGIGFIAQKGKILQNTSFVEKLSKPIQGGSGVVVEKLNDKRLYDYLQKIVETTNYSGWGLCEFKYCNKRNDFVFMEINSKWWASVEFVLRSNNGFIKTLLNADYKTEPCTKLIFLNRYVALPLKYMWKNRKLLKHGKTTCSGNLFKVLFELVFSIIKPNVNN